MLGAPGLLCCESENLNYLTTLWFPNETCDFNAPSVPVCYVTTMEPLTTVGTFDSFICLGGHIVQCEVTKSRGSFTKLEAVRFTIKVRVPVIKWQVWDNSNIHVQSRNRTIWTLWATFDTYCFTFNFLNKLIQLARDYNAVTAVMTKSLLTVE